MGKTHVIEVCGRRLEYGVAKNGKLMLTCDRCDIRKFCDENPHMETLCCNVSKNNEFLYETAQMVEDGKGATHGTGGREPRHRLADDKGMNFRKGKKSE